MWEEEGWGRDGEGAGEGTGGAGEGRRGAGQGTRSAGQGMRALGKGSFEQHFRELLTTLGLGMAGKKASRRRQEPKWHEAGRAVAQPLGA